MHSIVSQGKVEAVLASKPEERRELVEEAAGLGKFKRRKHRAELKLNRVGIQVERARDVEAEVRKRLRPAGAAGDRRRAGREARGEVARLRARIAELDLAAAARAPRRPRSGRRRPALGPPSAQEKLTALLAERHAAEEELADAAGRREAAIKALYRLQGATERIALRQEGAQACSPALRASSARPRRPRARSPTSRRASSSAPRRRPRPRGRAPPAALPPSGPVRPRSGSRRSSAQRRARRGAPRRPARERQALEAELADAAGGGRARPRALPARHGARADRDARRVRLGAARARRDRARRGGGGRESARAVARGARSGGRTRRPRGPGGRARARRSRRACRAREGAARGARALAGRARGHPPAARMLADEGAELALSLLDVEPGTERAVAAALGWRASAVVADDAGRRAVAAPARARGRPRQPRRARRQAAGRARRRAAGRPARRAARVHRRVGDQRGLRLRPAARRALVRGRGGRGGPARARDAPRAGAEVEELQAQARSPRPSQPRRRPSRRRGGGRVRAGRASPRRPRGRSGACCAGSRRRRPARRGAAGRRRRRGPARAAAPGAGRRGLERAGELAAELARVGALEHEARRPLDHARTSARPRPS